jgi:Peptidase propeptide and YPEB domain
MTFRAVNLLAVPALALGLALAAAPFAHAEESCHISGKMMTPTAMKASLVSRGYTNIRGLSTHNGCYEAKGIDAHGKRFEVEVNGVTGAIRRAE